MRSLVAKYFKSCLGSATAVEFAVCLGVGALLVLALVDPVKNAAEDSVRVDQCLNSSFSQSKENDIDLLNPNLDTATLCGLKNTPTPEPTEPPYPGGPGPGPGPGPGGKSNDLYTSSTSLSITLMEPK